MADDVMWSLAPDEIEQLLQLVEGVKDIPGCIVELGCFLGRTTVMLAQTAPERIIIAVDTFDNIERPNQLMEFQDTTAPYHNIQALCGKTQEVPLPTGPIALLLIDADHHYAACKADYERWTALVAPGGVAVFHDYILGFVGVIKTVTETGLQFERRNSLIWLYPHGKLPKCGVRCPLPAFYINLARSPDRKDSFLARVRDTVGPLLTLERFPGIIIEDADVPSGFDPPRQGGATRAGMYGCLLSHIGVVREAQRRGYPAVLVLEDDAAFTPEAVAVIPQALAEAPATAGLLYLGGFNRGNQQQYSTHLIKGQGFMGGIAYIVFQGAYEAVLREWEEAQPRAINDACLCRLVGVEKYATQPPIAYQQGGRSEISGSISVTTHLTATPPLSVHVFGHPTLPLDILAAPSDAQLACAALFCRLLSRAHVPYSYYGIEGSKVPEGGQFVSLGLPTASTWAWNNEWHEEYTKRLSAAFAMGVSHAQNWRQIAASTYGWAHAGVHSYAMPPIIEVLAGYPSVWATYKVFPSYAQQTILYATDPGRTERYKWFDTVIPHFLDPSDYPPAEHKTGDYALFIGRNNVDKGEYIAQQVCDKHKVKLRAYHDGLVGAEKAKVIANAIAVFTPSIYQEPFCLVAAESQMAGVPVISTDWGSFSEVVEPGKTGFRCRTMSEFSYALLHVPELDPIYIRERAIRLYSIDAVIPQYLKYFDFVLDVEMGSWYAETARRW